MCTVLTSYFVYVLFIIITRVIIIIIVTFVENVKKKKQLREQKITSKLNRIQTALKLIITITR